MHGRPRRVPAYSHHRASGKAVVRLDGKDHYLGDFGTPESHSRYSALIAQWQRQGEAKPAQNRVSAKVEKRPLTISELILRYAKFAAVYYSRDGKPTHEYSDMQYSLRPLRQIYGSTLAHDFGPLKLKNPQL